MKRGGKKAQDDSPTQFELALLAAILKVGHGEDLGTPDNYSMAKDALDLWRQCHRVLDEPQPTGAQATPAGQILDLDPVRQRQRRRIVEEERHRRSETARKAAARRWETKREAEQILRLPARFPVDLQTLLKHALPETADEKDRMRLFQEWEADCRKTMRVLIEKHKVGGFAEKTFRTVAVRILSWHLERKAAGNASPPGE
jgi:hypothetical protein